MKARQSIQHTAILTFVAYESDTLKRNSQNRLIGDEKYNNELLFLGHRSLIRNRTQTAVITIFSPFSLLYKYSFQNGIGTLENVC